MKKICKETVNSCLDCLRNKNFRNNYGELKGFIISKRPWQLLCSDIVGSYDASYYNLNGKFYILTITDVFSRVTSLFKIKRIDGETLIKKFSKFFKTRAIKTEGLLTDQGAQYKSKTLWISVRKTELKKIYLFFYTNKQFDFRTFKQYYKCDITNI
jgi:hypothetical protein